ncbi:urea transport system ATP-binding protein [Meinhardsimonia xiamenensis]|jgi:urea transport system ATP-binding protein|uniref:Urea transport system ATP-binding protein n=1 Tax=Meinhardsimonia xiamenensis TaxID=990712 RepID=A0A1G9FJG7_9RHOB|nr:urea ABC transporter ATP-binding protein UrtD [Meinhardsimonia xiamenensis]PRX37817.1 urea transport system ATP-binding protein [Meinhardsimonia xiamenensis]SDK88492.1 urea transport system ATP-binding protein [Meinhardsimonia xiamenensis]
MSGSLLYLSGVGKSFDGFRAIDNLSLVVFPGELRAVIGPNGAGKTTMMDIITGKTRPDEGEVFWKESVDLTRADEVETARLGIGRKFQKPSVIESLTVAENLELALKGPRGVAARLFGRRGETEAREIARLLALVRLEEARDAPAGSLSHGQKQWLEIGMLLAQDPELLLVDEPAAGMTDAETMRTAELLREIAGRHAVVVVEHDMEFVRALGCKVTVLHQGRVLAEGSLEHVSANPEVIEVYLGR